MPSNHVPDGKTQVALFQVRSRARTAENQRRSRANETMDRDRQILENARAEQKPRQIRNAEAAIVSLLQQSAAYRKTIERLAEAWGGDEAIDKAEEIFEEASKKIRENQEYAHAASEWAADHIGQESPAEIQAPKIRRKKPRQ